MATSALPAPQVEASESVQLCVFAVGDEEYALDIMRIEEILQPHAPTRVVGAPPWVSGVINLRGVIVPVVDLRLRLGSGPVTTKLKPKFIVCKVGRRRAALKVDGVTQVVRVGLDELKPAPAMLTGTHVSPDTARYVLGVFGTPQKLTLLLDIKALFAAGAGR